MFDENDMKWAFRMMFGAAALVGAVVGGVIVWAATR